MPRTKTLKTPVKSPLKLVRSGIFALKRKKWGKAQRKFEQALKDEEIQQNPGVWTNYGISLANLNRLTEAQEAFAKAANLDRKDPSIWIKKGLVEFQQEDYKEATNSFDKAQKFDKKDPEIVIFQARALNKQRAIKKAVKILENAIHKFPHSHQIPIELAKIFMQENEIKKSERVLEEAIRVSLNPDPGLILGQHLLDEKEYDQAIKIYGSVLERFPDSAHAQYGIGIANHAKRDWGAAIAAYDRTREMFRPNKPPQSFWINLARVLKQLKRHNEAIDALYRAKKSTKPTLEIFLLLAELYLAKDKPKRARDTLEEAAKLEKTNPIIPYFQGMTELRLGDSEQAKELLLFSLQLDPKLFDSKYQLALMAVRENDFREALSLAEDILVQDETYYPARKLAARLAFGLKQFNRTVELLEMSVVENPTKRQDELELLLLAWNKDEKGEEADRLLKHLIHAHPSLRDQLGYASLKEFFARKGTSDLNVR